MSHCCFAYLDNSILVLQGRVSAIAASLVHQKDLKLSGLKMNKEKLVLEPMQVGQWLGFITDTIKMQFRFPPKKIAKLKSNVDAIILPHTATFGDLARVARFTNSLYLAVGPIAKLFTRQIHLTIKTRSRWDCSFVGGVAFLVLIIIIINLLIHSKRAFQVLSTITKVKY